MWKTTTSGDDPAANGKVERAVGLFKEGWAWSLSTGPLLRATGLKPVSVRLVPLLALLCLSLFPLVPRSWFARGLGT